MLGGSAPPTRATPTNRLPRVADTEGRRLEEAAFSAELCAGRVLAVRYSDEPNLFHERLLLWPSKPRRGQQQVWAIRIPDGDTYLEDVFARTPADGPDKVALMDLRGVAPVYLQGRLYGFKTFPTDAEDLHQGGTKEAGEER